MMLLAFYAFEFWKCARGRRDEEYWWDAFVERRARAMHVSVGWRKFR